MMIMLMLMIMVRVMMIMILSAILIMTYTTTHHDLDEGDEEEKEEEEELLLVAGCISACRHCRHKCYGFWSSVSSVGVSMEMLPTLDFIGLLSPISTMLRFGSIVGLSVFHRTAKPRDNKP